MSITKIYHHPFFSQIFHTLVYCLQRELRNCESVLDLGCGPFSPLFYCKNVKNSVGIEPFLPYLEESRKRGIHNKYLREKAENLDFPDNSFDAVIMIEFMEHLTKKKGQELIKKAEKWAKKKIIISTPNGYFPMLEVDENILQKHLSGWSVEDFRKLGFKCFGLAGLKFFYHKVNQVSSLIDSGGENSLANIRFRPKMFFYIINSFLQIFSYYLPQQAFELFAVKKLKNV